MNLLGKATVHSSRVKARQLAMVTSARLGGGAWSWRPRTATASGAAVRGAVERYLVGEGLLGSFLLRAQAPGAVGRAAEPRALAPGRRLGAEVVEVLHELRRP